MDGTVDEDAAGFIQAAINQIEQNSLKKAKQLYLQTDAQLKVINTLPEGKSDYYQCRVCNSVEFHLYHHNSYKISLEKM